MITKSTPVTVIINVHNEFNTIEKEILDIYEKIISKIPGSELIVAEDGSTDGTKEVITRLAKDLGIVHSTSEERKGYAKALKDAFSLSMNPYILFSDTGGKYDFSEFWKLYEVCDRYSLVIGVRTHRNDQLYRRLLTWGYSFILGKYFKVSIKDADSGFRVYSKTIIDKIAREKWVNKYLINSELTLRVMYSGGKVGYVPVMYKQRDGVSKGLPPLEIPKVILNVLKKLSILKDVIDSDSYAKI